MSFKQIRFYNFRNLENNSISIESPVIFLVGKNGQGKTNFIEAVYYSCYGSSFRVSRDRHVIKREEKEALIAGRFSGYDNMEHEVELLFKGRKEIRVDGKKIKDRKFLIENQPCIVFSYDDMSFVNGPPEKKRWFFNQTHCLFDTLFIDLLRDYKKVLDGRNILVKTGKKELLDVYDQKLVEVGLDIMIRRKKLILEFNQLLTPLFKEISGEEYELEILYKPSWKNEQKEMVIHSLWTNRAKDFTFKTTTSGPHRDNFIFLMNGGDFSHFGSTGQTRLVSLILRIAQSRFFLMKTGKKPVLLLDDVLLEMDGDKRLRIMSHLPEFEQAFFTFLPNEDWMGYPFKEREILKVHEGRVKKWKKPGIY